MVDALKLQNVGVCQRVSGTVRVAPVFVVISLVPAGIGAARAQGGAGFSQHGIMGQGHRFAGCGIAQMAARPAGEQGMLLSYKILAFKVIHSKKRRRLSFSVVCTISQCAAKRGFHYVNSQFFSREPFVKLTKYTIMSGGLCAGCLKQKTAHQNGLSGLFLLAGKQHL